METVKQSLERLLTKVRHTIDAADDSIEILRSHVDELYEAVDEVDSLLLLIENADVNNEWIVSSQRIEVNDSDKMIEGSVDERSVATGDAQR